MPRIAVLFELRCAETRPGEAICVLGQRPELGGWDRHADAATAGALQLRTSAFMYPRWAMLRPVWLEVGGPGKVLLEYKYVMDRRLIEKSEGRQAKWEDGMPNRQVTLSPEEGSVWLISDAQWGSSQQPRVGRISMSEVCNRWSDFDPEWMHRGQLHLQRQPANFLLSPRVASTPPSEDDVSYPIVQEFNALSPKTKHSAFSQALSRGSPTETQPELPAALGAAFVPRKQSPVPQLRLAFPPESPPVAPPESPPRTPPLRTPPPLLPRLRLVAAAAQPPCAGDKTGGLDEEEEPPLAGAARTRQGGPPLLDPRRDEEVAALRAENAVLRERREELRTPLEDPKKDEEMAALKAENAVLRERLRELLAGQDCKVLPTGNGTATTPPRESEGDPGGDNGEGAEELRRVLARRRSVVDSKGEHWTKERHGSGPLSYFSPGNSSGNSPASVGFPLERAKLSGVGIDTPRKAEDDVIMQEPQEEPQVEG
mmetsp:Transcript_85103/g.214545  ORF Transcript_85103/g.214545 Transcript_85103/m.214545 type:complete len:484 (-) Transcript_85103:255-1706(-)